MVCPYCQETQKQVKAGKNGGIQRYKCEHCQRRYTPETRRRGYPDALQQRAVALHAQGLKIRQISRDLGVNHQTVANWIRQQAQRDTALSGMVAGVADSAIPVPGEPSVEVVRDPTRHEGKVLRKERATIADVARLAKVSPTTISNFINAKGRMSEETRRRIAQAMEELYFTPSALTRAIRQRRTHILGLLIFGLHNLDASVGKSLTPPLLAGIYEAANQAGHDILVFTGWPNRPERHSGLDFLNGHIDGLLWVAPNLQTPVLERLATAGLPVVALLTRHVPDAVGYINADNIAAVQDVVAHLKAEGRKRIAYLGPIAMRGNINSNWQDRLEGYRLGLAYHRELALGITVELQGEMYLSYYDGPNVLFGTTRRDQTTRVQGSVYRRDWILFGFDPVLSLILTRNASNQDLFAYRREQLELGFTKEF